FFFSSSSSSFHPSSANNTFGCLFVSMFFASLSCLSTSFLSQSFSAGGRDSTGQMGKERMDGWMALRGHEEPKVSSPPISSSNFLLFLFLFFTFKALLLDIPDGGRRAAELVGIGYRILDGRTGGT